MKYCVQSKFGNKWITTSKEFSSKSDALRHLKQERNFKKSHPSYRAEKFRLQEKY